MLIKKINCLKIIKSPVYLLKKHEFGGLPWYLSEEGNGTPLQYSCLENPMDGWTVARQAPLSMGILQARILEWVAMPSSRESFQPGD